MSDIAGAVDREIAGRMLPVVDPDNRPFFEGAARGELWMQRCVETGRLQYYPRPCSIRTGGPVDWVRCSGRGTVHSFTIIRTNYPEPHFQLLAPYVVAMIELAEGVKMMSNVTGCSVTEVRIGLPVEAHFVCVHAKSGLFLPFWHKRDP